MLVKVLGLADLFSAVVVLLLHYKVIGWKLGLLVMLYLLIKGFAFRSDLNSIMDILCGVYILVMLFGFTTFVSWIIAIYLFQKAVFSLG